MGECASGANWGQQGLEAVEEEWQEVQRQQGSGSGSSSSQSPEVGLEHSRFYPPFPTSLLPHT